MEPIVVPRSQHTLSRRDIDSDALRVLYRLKDSNFAAYLVGGSVRDLLLGRRPKDFDIGTSAHPYQIKKLFRNCWIVGRRFRLAHVRFGPKIIEVATFRRQVPADDIEDTAIDPEVEERREEDFDRRQQSDRRQDPDRELPEIGNRRVEAADRRQLRDRRQEPVDHLIQHDNTFGTPEEDAFRRDFTVNALFYDIATFSVIDYVGGLRDLEAGVIRCIGDPDVRFREDPVRMQRAIALSKRLGFRIDEPIYESIARHGGELARSAPARLLEEYYKILRSGAAAETFAELGRVGLLAPICEELDRGVSAPRDGFTGALAALDRYRARFESIPDTLTNAILLGTLLVPLGIQLPGRPRFGDDERRRPPRLSLGLLPIARRDVERLRQILALQRRLRDLSASPRARRALMQRGSFREALTWLEIHGDAPAAVESWRSLIESLGPVDLEQREAAAAPRRRRRRRPRFTRPVGT